MAPLESGTYVPIALWIPLVCPHCSDGRFTRRIGAMIEPAMNTEGEFLGLDGILRFESCGHFLPGTLVDPCALAALMNDMEAEGRGWEPQEEFDPDNVEVDD